MVIKLDIEIGDIVLGGKFKNKRIEVKSISKDELGQPTINGKSILKFRIEKLLPKEKQSKKTGKTMKEQAYSVARFQKLAGLLKESAEEKIDVEEGSQINETSPESRWPSREKEEEELSSERSLESTEEPPEKLYKEAIVLLRQVDDIFDLLSRKESSYKTHRIDSIRQNLETLMLKIERTKQLTASHME